LKDGNLHEMNTDCPDGSRFYIDIWYMHVGLECA